MKKVYVKASTVHFQVDYTPYTTTLIVSFALYVKNDI